MNKLFKENLEKGQAMITATIFFLVISLTIIFGLIDPVTRETRNISDLHSSRKSLYLSEAGMEDVVYRLKNGLEVNEPMEILTLDGYSATTVVVNSGGGKLVTSSGDWNDHIRNLQTKLVPGIGIAFSYGVQTGAGGFNLSNNSGVNGNVYSNGNITGSPGAYITGSAFAAGTLINKVTVGTGIIGDAWAQSVTGSTIRGALYCQTGSGNNKSCDTSRANPVAEAFPITDENIITWEDEALSGGTIGTQTIDGISTTLGPSKINGNLTVTNGAVLTVTGTLWVTGNIILDNNVIMKLPLNYGSASAVVLTNGRVTISNNATFEGSGEEGSRIMILTTSDCPTSSACGSNPAISVANNAGTVILNAQNGTISFSNNAGAKAATAKTISLQNNAVITYDSGLINTNFASGPGGGWDIRSWKEIE